LQSLTLVQQTVKMLQQLAELQALYNQGVQTYNNVGNYAKKFKEMTSSDYWKKKLQLNLDWRDIGHLNQQLGISRDKDSELYAINQDLFGSSYGHEGFFTALDGSLDNLERTVDDISLQHSMRNICIGAQRDMAAQDAARQRAEDANVNAARKAAEQAAKLTGDKKHLDNLQNQLATKPPDSEAHWKQFDAEVAQLNAQAAIHNGETATAALALSSQTNGAVVGEVKMNTDTLNATGSAREVAGALDDED
jgi:hypothetical protein